MRATSLSINTVGPCNAKCPFCIAQATWKSGVTNNRRIEHALAKALAYATYHRIDTVLITGSGEPTLQQDLILRIASEARRAGIPIVELQTNGLRLAREPALVGALAGHGVTTLALSVAASEPELSARLMEVDLDYLTLLQDLTKQGFLLRVSLNLNRFDRALVDQGLADYAKRLVAHGVRQLTLRRLGVPQHPLASERAQACVRWVEDNAMAQEDVAALEAEVLNHGTPLRQLSYGATVYDFCGLSVVVTTCQSENPNPNEIRSIILQPDGHLYHSWEHPGSILL